MRGEPMEKQSYVTIIKDGLITQNPIFRLLLGMCPTLAISTAAIRGLSMGLATTVVLVLSNLAISSIRKIIPERIRIPSFVVVIATFVTIVDLFIKAFSPALSKSLGIYIPLIVVNCIIFARAETFAFKNPIPASVIDGLSMGLGFTLAITILSSIREIIGSGTFFDMPFMPAGYEPMALAVRPSGGFIMLGILLLAVDAATRQFEKRKAAKAEEENA